ncbi:LdhA, Lactate dehydrogenase and related dehydrogenase [Pyrenophora tritici-repentis]|uniref:LdhA, Lactate dehydrogenase and related dehydrogenase n=1 Tax=Pyrenophora tritici-repentis TaxID=45151 RepID=A0A834RZH0_9PLEO|nr:LdhA, Lactate dehydrogenase and related dehydrogenase [Pyrenophora tritici-repentis]
MASNTHSTNGHEIDSSKPTILHLGEDIRWNHELYEELKREFNIVRTYSMNRSEFKKALAEKQWGDFVGMYRPFWNTGGEMGNWNEELISLLPSSCKIYASAGAGFDWVDTRALAAHGTIYCNSASACTESVADTAIVLILSCYRNITWSFLAARSCDPQEFRNANQNIAAVTHNPNGSTLGIIGLGRIGLRIAQKATRAFEMKIAYYDVIRMEEREKEVGARWCATLGELLSTSDCVLVATPFEGETLLSTEQFGKFKKGASLVNIARGKLIDENALVEAMDKGIVAAAGLDVHADEPNVNPKLAKRSNVMVLSHTAGASVESHVGFERLGMENLLGWKREGRRGCVSAVNLQWLKE